MNQSFFRSDWFSIIRYEMDFTEKRAGKSCWRVFSSPPREGVAPGRGASVRKPSGFFLLFRPVRVRHRLKRRLTPIGCQKLFTEIALINANCWNGFFCCRRERTGCRRRDLPRDSLHRYLLLKARRCLNPSARLLPHPRPPRKIFCYNTFLFHWFVH